MDSTSPLPPRPTDNLRVERPLPRLVNPPPAPLPDAPSPGMGVGDIYYVLFRHKWKIILCSILGAAAAAAFYVFFPPPFQSQAKLFVRYVVTEARTTGPAGDNGSIKSPDVRGETVMDSEEEILTSFDLSSRVADAVGPERILAKLDGGKDPLRAAVTIRDGLLVEVPRNSSVIHVSFSHPDPTIVQPVLAEIVRQYLKTHVEIHRAVGIIGDFLSQETDQLRNRLAQTEEELRKARNKAGVISLEDSKKEFSGELARLRDAIRDAQAELAQRTSIYNELNKKPGGPPVASVEPEAAVPRAKLDEYRAVLWRIELLSKREQDLLTQFTGENSRVKDVRSQLADSEVAKKKLEDDYPKLVSGAAASSATPAPGVYDLPTEYARLNALQARIKELNVQLDQVRADAARVDQLEGSILELLRKKELEESNYRYYSARLEQSRINEALGTGKVSNISEIQSPSPPSRDRKKTLQIIGGLFGGGLALGLAWAFAIELFFDHTVRRPIDVERMLGLPLFLSIPVLNGKGKRGKAKALAKGSADPAVPAAGASPSLALRPSEAERLRLANAPLMHSFYETLRDRLIGYFESRGLTHKPKLLAVTGLDRGSGVTTTAAGLANCLSETGEGNVLLVDMTAGQGSAKQFYRGQEVVGLEDILSIRDSAQVKDNLFVVVEEPGTDRLSRILPQRFSKLVPQLKASNFDYIIFDMPPVSQISITPRLAGFMDMVLLVIESEKTNRELVQRATALLAQSNAPVGAILNKNVDYVPQRLHQDNLSNF